MPATADGTLVGVVRMTNEAIGGAYGIAATSTIRWKSTAGTGQATFVAVYQAGTGFTTSDPFTIVVNIEQVT